MITSTIFIWLRRYVVVASIVLLAEMGWAVWRFYELASISPQGGLVSQALRGFAINVCAIVLFALLLLVSWWRFGRIVFRIGVSVFFLSGAFATWKSSWGVLHGARVLPFLFLVTAFAAHSLWLFYAPQSKPREPNLR